MTTETKNPLASNAWIALIGIACSISLFAHPPFAAAQMLPERELDSLRPAPVFDVNLFASEPMVANPSAIDIDTQGRVWVVEIERYRSAATRNPPSEKIKVLEDTDDDGKADKMTVFYEGLFCPMSICVAGDKVYVATSPDLWVFEDKDSDLKADGPPTKLLTGFRGYNHDHGAHSLVLGPDHKWWMSHGDGGFDVTGTDGSRAAYRWGAVLRGELDGSKLETPAVNFRNPYEVCISSFGEAFLSDNDNDGLQSTRICWIMEGGNYGWFGRPPERAPAGTPYGEAWHFRGHIPGHVPGTLVTGFGSPCGICFYEGDSFGPALKNKPLHCDAGPAEVRSYLHQVQGAGMRASKEVILSASDRYFRPDDICVAPDGSLFVADWYDGGVGGHAYNNPNQGRIFQLKPKGKKLPSLEKPGPYDNLADAAAGLKSPNLATQFLARERFLAEGEKSIPALTALLADAEPNFRARSLWVLDRIGGPGRELVVRQLKSDDPAMRALAVRILRRHGEENAADILPLAGDKSLEVVREVLLAIRNISGDQAETALAEIAKRYDGADRYLLEAINVAVGERKEKLYQQIDKHGGFAAAQIDLLQLLNPEAAAELFQRQLFDPKAEAASTRKLLAWAGSSTSPEIGGRVLEFVLKQDPAEKPLRQLALNLLAAKVKGPWRNLTPDKNMASLLGKLMSDAEMQESAVQLVAAWQLTGFSEQVLSVAANTKLDPNARALAIQTAAQQVGDDKNAAVAVLRKLLADQNAAIRQAAILALVDLQDFKSVRDALTNQNNQLPARFRTNVVNRMLTSTGGMLAMLKLVEDNQLPAQLKDQVITRAVQHPDANVSALFEQFVPAERRQPRLGEKVSADDILALTGDPKRGSDIFLQSSAAQCNKCHTIHGTGGNLGPDLSMIGKKYERATLLETILDPSKAIAPEFVTYVAETSDGRMLAGFLIEQNEKITLKDAQGKLLEIPANQVESLNAQKKSVMPDLVLRDVTAQDAADLLAYLLTLK